MSTVTYDKDNLQAITAFEDETGVDIKASVIHDDKAYFVVPENKAGMAIGKNGRVVSRVKERTNRDVKIYEYSENLGKFVNSIVPTEIRGVDLEDGGKKVEIHVPERNKGKVVGRNGEKIETIRQILSRTHSIETVEVS